MGTYTMQPQKEYYETFYGKKIKITTKTGEVDGRLEKVRIDLEDLKCYIYVRDIGKNLLKLDHDDIVRVE